ncbi:hypothetical protein WOLCODRAFT_136616 [Wolfiporia cocos MD-104 SS10]|uniref:AN1-type domain-containing protein n=1 Tax=Wolfiporia cocos (strain MD-104) TaxID=742152 RepID=A0A2H3JQJ9_WOLCO|nr:hypothetical protein WOLCODRAFT_136616 [Wolfiporia cocos MD-104 SS10]
MTSSSTPERDAQLLSIGKQCAAPLCRLVDYLPFKCQHCARSFCSEHFRPEAHSCEKFDVSKHNRVAPSCPLCNTPVTIPQGQDPNIRMDAHITTECSVMTGRAKQPSIPICARAKCGKKLFAPIRCDKCKQQFCPSHRFPASHTCVSTATTSNAPSASTRIMSDVATRTSAASAAAMAAIQRAMVSTNQTPRSVPATPQRSPQPPAIAKASSSSSSSTRSNPLSATDRLPVLPAPKPTVASPGHSSPPTAGTTNEPRPHLPDATPTPNANTTPTKSFVLNPKSYVPPPLFASA